MSIQAQCREAMNSLAQRDSVFTEIDVVNEASQGKGWTDKLFREATERAYIVLQSEYKKGGLVRFGPVTYDGAKDYARRGTKIVYAHPTKGPKSWATPNGQFPALHADRDALLTPGRRPVHITSRDDSRPWSEQKVSKAKERHLRPVPGGPPVDTRPFEKRIAELEAELNRYKKEHPEVAVPVAPAANGNGNGAIQTVNVDINDLIDVLAERVEKRIADDLIESVKERVAEALIA